MMAAVHGICLLRTESGEPHSVRVEDSAGIGNDLDIWYYEQQGYQPPWQELDDCPGTGRYAPPKRR